MPADLKLFQTIGLGVLPRVLTGFLANATGSLLWMAMQSGEEETFDSLRLPGYIDELPADQEPR